MKRVIAAIYQFFSFEALLVLYLFAGTYKAGDAFKQYSIVVDPTLFLFLASLVVGISIFIKQGIKFEKHTVHLLFIFIIFIAYVGLSLSWSKSEQYGMTKFLYLGVLNFWNLIGASLIIATDIQRIRRFMYLVLVFSLIYAAMSLPLAMDLGRDETIGLTGSDYLGIAFILGVGLMVLICVIIDTSQPKFIRAIAFLISCIYFWILLFVGGRGYLIASLLALIVLFFLSPLPITIRRKVYMYRRYIILLLIIFASMVYVLEITGKTPATLSRLMVLTTPTTHDSASTRVSFYKIAIENWKHNPIFGTGIGSFPTVAGDIDSRAANAGYPHNLILEILTELGLVGLLIYALFLFTAVRLSLKSNLIEDYPVVLFVFLLFIQCFTEAMFSGDISDHRFLMVSLGLMMMPRESSQHMPDSPQASIEIAPVYR